MARVVAEIDGQGGGRDWWPGGGQVPARVAARVAAGVSTRVAPPVCRCSILRRKEILKSNLKKML